MYFATVLYNSEFATKVLSCVIVIKITFKIRGSKREIKENVFYMYRVV